MSIEMRELEYSAPEPVECPECEAYLDSDGKCALCNYAAPTAEDFADAAFERAGDR